MQIYDKGKVDNNWVRMLIKGRVYLVWLQNVTISFVLLQIINEQEFCYLNINTGEAIRESFGRDQDYSNLLYPCMPNESDGSHITGIVELVELMEIVPSGYLDFLTSLLIQRV